VYNYIWLAIAKVVCLFAFSGVALVLEILFEMHEHGHMFKHECINMLGLLAYKHCKDQRVDTTK
jgi:hypothetical protein